MYSGLRDFHVTFDILRIVILSAIVKSLWRLSLSLLRLDSLKSFCTFDYCRFGWCLFEMLSYLTRSYFCFIIEVLLNFTFLEQIVVIFIFLYPLCFARSIVFFHHYSCLSCIGVPLSPPETITVVKAFL